VRAARAPMVVGLERIEFQQRAVRWAASADACQSRLLHRDGRISIL